jgi:hypothetical protein
MPFESASVAGPDGFSRRLLAVVPHDGASTGYLKGASMEHLLIALMFAIALAVMIAATVGLAAGLLAHMSGEGVITVITRGAVAFAGALTLLLAMLALGISVMF